MTNTSTDHTPEVSSAPDTNTVRLIPQEMHAPLFWDVYRNKKQPSTDE